MSQGFLNHFLPQQHSDQASLLQGRTLAFSGLCSLVIGLYSAIKWGRLGNGALVEGSLLLIIGMPLMLLALRQAWLSRTVIANLALACMISYASILVYQLGGQAAGARPLCRNPRRAPRDHHGGGRDARDLPAGVRRPGRHGGADAGDDGRLIRRPARLFRRRHRWKINGLAPASGLRPTTVRTRAIMRGSTPPHGGRGRFQTIQTIETVFSPLQRRAPQRHQGLVDQAGVAHGQDLAAIVGRLAAPVDHRAAGGADHRDQG